MCSRHIAILRLFNSTDESLPILSGYTDVVLCKCVSILYRKKLFQKELASEMDFLLTVYFICNVSVLGHFELFLPSTNVIILP